MKSLKPVQFSRTGCDAELSEFASFLANNDALDEAPQILPFFREREHLSSFLGTMHGRLVNPDRLGYEFNLFGDFAADVVIGDSERGAYVLVEFEDAHENSVFVPGSRHRSHYSTRLEKGFSQLVDWLWLLDDQSQTSLFAEAFGTKTPFVRTLLVIGRTAHLSDSERRRLAWRSQNVSIQSHAVQILTYDQLCDSLQGRFDLFSKSPPGGA